MLDSRISANSIYRAIRQIEFGLNTLRRDQRVRSVGVAVAANQAVEILRKNQLEKFWIHLDADVLEDVIMPAVDYRLAGGLSWDELSATLRILMASGQAVGINVGIFNPRLDEDGSIARRFVESLVAGLVA